MDCFIDKDDGCTNKEKACQNCTDSFVIPVKTQAEKALFCELAHSSPHVVEVSRINYEKHNSTEHRHQSSAPANTSPVTTSAVTCPKENYDKYVPKNVSEIGHSN